MDNTFRDYDNSKFQTRVENTYKKMLESDKPYEFEHWWNLFWDNDQTIIMTKDEHDKARDKVECHIMNWENGYFSCNSLVGFKYRKSVEGAYLKSLTEDDWVPLKTIKDTP